MSIYYLLDSVLSFEYLEMINILLLFRVGAKQLVVLGGEVEVVETGEEQHEEESQGQVGGVGEDWSVDKSLHRPHSSQSVWALHCL